MVRLQWSFLHREVTWTYLWVLVILGMLSQEKKNSSSQEVDKGTLWTSSWRKDLCCWTSTEGYCACSEICVLEKWNRMWYFNWKQRWNLKIRAHSHLVGGCLYLPSLWKLNTARRCLYMLFKDLPTKVPLQYMSETIHIL